MRVCEQCRTRLSILPSSATGVNGRRKGPSTSPAASMFIRYQTKHSLLGTLMLQLFRLVRCSERCYLGRLTPFLTPTFDGSGPSGTILLRPRNHHHIFYRRKTGGHGEAGLSTSANSRTSQQPVSGCFEVPCTHVSPAESRLRVSARRTRFRYATFVTMVCTCMTGTFEQKKGEGQPNH